MVNKYTRMALSLKQSNDMDQERYLREITHHYCALEKPLPYGPQIGTLTELIEALHKEFETNFVNIEMVNHLMLVYKSNAKDWRKFAKFDRYKYTRNLVDAGNGRFNLMILCWGEGHGSAIHDHADSHCFMKMLKGELVETRYEMPSQVEDCADTKIADIGECAEDETTEALKETLVTPIRLNDVAYINDNIGLHRVENPSHTETAVSLHLYCPPFNSCSVFQPSGKKMTCHVTFWSKYGKRERQQT